MKNFTRLGRVCAYGVALGGLAALAPAQQHAPSTRSDDRDARTPAVNFLTYSELTSMAVTNRNGEEIGSISDAIVERGSAHCTFYILKSDTTLGLGGRLTAIPADVFGWDASKNHLSLDATPEQIAMMPEFSDERWEGLAHVSGTWDELTSALARESTSEREVYIKGDASPEPISMEGNITQVERRMSDLKGEEIILHVRADKSKMRDNAPRGNDVRVILGPSWYVMSQPQAPMRGYTFEGEVAELPRSSDAPSYVALSAEINGKDLDLRDPDTHQPRWDVTGANDERDADRQRSMRAPYALLSDYSGADVQCRGQDCGGVSDLIVDQPSGSIAFIVIDPDENFLGIADTNRLVPAEIANLGADGVIRIDASKEMVLSSRALPDDLNTLESQSAYTPVYRAYELDAPKFKPMKRRDWSELLSQGGWSHDSEFVKAVRDAKDVEIEGTIVRVEYVSPNDNMSRATALVVKTEQGTQNVLLGPTWFINRQGLAFRNGDAVTITARHATINGQPYVVACRVHGENEREISLWVDDKPAWDRR